MSTGPPSSQLVAFIAGNVVSNYNVSTFVSHQSISYSLNNITSGTVFRVNGKVVISPNPGVLPVMTLRVDASSGAWETLMDEEPGSVAADTYWFTMLCNMIECEGTDDWYHMARAIFRQMRNFQEITSVYFNDVTLNRIWAIVA